jgi:hypothetical protein
MVRFVSWMTYPVHRISIEFCRLDKIRQYPLQTEDFVAPRRVVFLCWHSKIQCPILPHSVIQNQKGAQSFKSDIVCIVMFYHDFLSNPPSVPITQRDSSAVISSKSCQEFRSGAPRSSPFGILRTCAQSLIPPLRKYQPITGSGGILPAKARPFIITSRHVL